MEIPPLSLLTDAAVEVVPQLALDASYVAVVIIKERFSFDRRGRVERVGPAEIRPIDVPRDPDVDQSSPRYTSDVCIRKPSTDVVVVGKAMAPGGAPARVVNVSARVGPVERRLRVHGPRVWYRSAVGRYALSDPQPFTALELAWEEAWGGMDTSEPRTLAHEPRNPVGRGVVADPSTLIDRPGPRIEDPDHPIEDHRFDGAPAGLAPVPTWFEPRRSFAGTYDQRWAEERMPLLPADFDDRHNLIAPEGMVSPQPLRGGEPVELVNLSPDGVQRFTLPRLVFHVGAEREDGVREHRAMLDTVLLEPHEQLFEMTWRAPIPVPRRARLLRGIRVFEKEELT